MARRLSSPVFIGRAAELDRVAELIARVAATGHGETVLVTGEAGIGKTRFLREIATRAHGDGWLVLSGACDEFGATARPFSALTEMTPALEAFVVGEAPGELERPAWAALQALATGAAAPADTGSVAQLALDLFKRVSAVRPLFVVVDDLHWADESLRGLFGTLARGLAGSTAVVVGAYRDNEVDRAHPLRPVLAAVHRNAAPEVIPLPPLAVEDAAELARAVGAGHEGAELAALHERSGGNTFLIEELLAAPPGQIPAGARDVVLSRLQGLPADTVFLAELAALDTSFDQAVLSHASDLDRGPFAEAFDALVGSQLVIQDGERVAYRHALIREVIAESIPPARKAGMHVRLALSHEANHQGRVGTIARHWLESGEKERALVAAIAAAERAFEIGAPPESADWYDKALELWDEVAKPEALAGCSRAALALQADEAFTACRRFGRSVDLFEDLLRERSKLSNAEHAELWLQLSFRCWQVTGNEERTLPLSLEAMRRARGALDDEMAPAQRVRLLSHYIGHAVSRFGLDAEAADALEIASAIVVDLPDAAHPMFEGARFHVLASVGSRELFDAICQHPDRVLSSSPNRPAVEAGILNGFGFHDLNIRRGVAALDSIYEDGMALALGFSVEANVGPSFSALGRWTEGLERWAKLETRLGPEPIFEWANLAVQGWGALRVRTGNVAAIWPLFEEGSRWNVPFNCSPFLGSQALVGVEGARINNNRGASRRAVAEVMEIEQGHHMAKCGEAVAYAISSEADASFGAGGQDREAVALADYWMERLRSCLDFAPGRARLYDLGMFLAQAGAERARLLGNDAVETWEDLAQHWHDLPRPYHEAYCRYRAASALLMAPAAAERKASRERAAAHLEAALAITLELGAVYLEADVRELQKAAGLRTRMAGVAAVAPPAPAANGHSELTPRELEVLRLLVAGESNGQIAIRLGISVKTASVHVSNILRKLEVENRVEAAVRASRMGLAV